MAKQTEAANPFEQFFAGMTENAFSQPFEQILSMAGPFGDIGRDSVQAMSQSWQATTQGMTAMNARQMSFLKTSMARNLAAMNAAAQIGSVEDFTRQQSEFASTSLQTLMAEFNEMSQLFSNTIREAAAPLNAQAGKIAETINSAS